MERMFCCWLVALEDDAFYYHSFDETSEKRKLVSPGRLSCRGKFSTIPRLKLNRCILSGSFAFLSINTGGTSNQ